MPCLVNLFTLGDSDSVKLRKALDIKKAHGHGNILVSMIKLCTYSVAHRLTLIFRNSMAADTFTTQWKRKGIVPIHKKDDKQIVSNHRPVYFLPICSKS